MVQSAPSDTTTTRGLKRGRATLRATLPPKFNGLIGAYPQALFRPDTVKMGQCDGALMFVDGRAVPLDGKAYRLNRGERAMSIGNFIAAHVVNEREVETPVEIAFDGVSADVGGELAPGPARLGQLLIGLDEEPAPDEPAPSEVDEGSTPDEGDGQASSGVLGEDDPSRVMLRSAIVALLSSFVAPMLIDVLMPKKEEPGESESFGFERPKHAEVDGDQIYVTELQGVGEFPRPPGKGWMPTMTVPTRDGSGMRTVWRRCPECAAAA